MPQQHWLPAPNSFTLLEHEVHVWKAELDLSSASIEILEQWLSPDELARARRLKFPQHQRRFTASKGLLRYLLGRYLNLPPQQISIEYGSHGKPKLAPASMTRPLYFNTSDSQDLALYAFTLNREIGIDVEFIRENLGGDEIASRFFSGYENRALQSLPVQERTAAFFRCWTRKEAFIKAIGEGLSFPLSDFDVSFGTDEPVALLSIRGDAAQAQQWRLLNLDPKPGFAGAFAVKGQADDLKLFKLEPTFLSRAE